ncbi:MAG TPA: hypothetical protein PKY87_15605 [Terricaulis sp.]|nr:hypothetical protein [Terricaulis sp.]
MLRAPDLPRGVGIGSEFDLTSDDLEWREAELNACPGAIDVFSQLESAHWVAPEMLRWPDLPPGSTIVAHPRFHHPIVDITISYSGRGTTRFSGYLDEGGPGGWAHYLAAALEPCWRPTQAPPPWR